MPEHFSPLSASALLQMILHDEKQGHIFGIPSGAFYKPASFSFPWNGSPMHTPFGVAAGPHTQLTQNILSAWLCGARFIELKTVQTLDELKIPRPCIDAPDEGYNCEWSQELRIPQSFEEYLKAWVLLHLLAHKFGFPAHGTVFNMSVGYNLEGIQKENVQWFLAKMKHCPDDIERIKKELQPLFPEISSLRIPSCISDSVTLSTMHGCPPDEIEKIGMYLIREKKLNTIIKLNPTLLGPDRMRGIIEDLGHSTQIPDEAFAHDLKFADAKNIVNNLWRAAQDEHLFFGVKLTNTLECVNQRGVLPESVVYMSGRHLHPLSIAVAGMIREIFGTELPVSFSAGGDAFNITDLLSSGLFPVTVCTDLLRPGGYGRLKQYAEDIESEFSRYSATTLTEFIKMKSGNSGAEEALRINLADYSEKIMNGDDYRKTFFREPPPKSKRTLAPFDCTKAPCMEGCPTQQDIPEYLHFASLQDWNTAMQVIRVKNPFPNILGKVCDHECQTRCTRSWYDNAIFIRDVKRVIAEKGKEAIPPRTEDKYPPVAIIGAGPAGLACAYYLRQSGFPVTVFEEQADAGGMAAKVIPQFRLDRESLLKDVDHIVNAGVNIQFNSRVDKDSFSELRNKFKYIFIATGAPKARTLDIPGAEHPGVYDALRFLEEIKKDRLREKPGDVVVVGGGNSAVDAARSALRLTDGKVTLVYRRSRSEMPALQEEIQEMIDEGVILLEMTSPLSVIVSGNKIRSLRCIQNKAGEPDASGRRSPVAMAGSEFEIPCSLILHALGQENTAPLAGRSTGESFLETEFENVFMGGDLARGASNIVKAAADGRAVALTLLAKENHQPREFLSGKKHERNELMLKRTRRIKRAVPQFHAADSKSFQLSQKSLTQEQAVYEASRCLHCDEMCSLCVTVCPNRANIVYKINPCRIPEYEITDGKAVITGYAEFTQVVQVLNLADSCNECGNCVTFCPTSGKPWQDKPRVFLSKDAFQHHDYGCWFEKENKLRTMYFKVNGETAKLQKQPDGNYHLELKNLSLTIHNSTKEISACQSSEKNYDLRFLPAWLILFENVELY